MADMKLEGPELQLHLEFPAQYGFEMTKAVARIVGDLEMMKSVVEKGYLKVHFEVKEGD